MSDTRGPEYGDGEETVAASEAAPEETADIFVEPEHTRPRARLLPMWILLAAVILVGVAWAVSERYLGESGGGPDSVPLITAKETPVKVRPDEPGGVDVPDRDKYVYKSLTDEEPDSEQLLPAPEEPMERPSVEVSEIEAPPEQAVSGEPAEESTAEAVEEAPEPVHPEELSVAAVEPPLELETEVEEAVEQVVETAVALVEKPEVPAQQPQELLDAVTPEPEPAPEPIPEPEPTPEPEPVPTPEPEPAPIFEPEPEPAAAPIAAGSGFMVQVGATKNETAAQEGLARLAKQQAKILAALGTAVVRADLGDKGIWYRMRVGPLATRAEADDVCGQLKVVDVGCYVVAN